MKVHSTASPLARFGPAVFVTLWSTGFIGARYAMPWAEPFGFLTLRFGIAFVLMAGLAVALRRRRLAPREAMHAMISGGLMHGVYLGCVFWAISEGMPAGLSALVIGLQPLVTAVMADRILGERLARRHWLGLGVGLAGVTVVVVPGMTSTANVTIAMLAVCILGMLAISAGTIWQKRHAANVDLVTGTMWQYLGGIAPMVVMAWLFEDGVFTPNAELVFALAWLVLVLSVGAVFLLMRLIRDGAVAKVGSLFYLVPAVTALMAFLLFGERFTLTQLAGMAVTMVGVAIATQPAMRARASA